MMPLRHVLLALLVVLVFGLAFPVIKIGLYETSPLLLTALRFFFSAIPAIFFIRKPAASWAAILGYGVLIGIVLFGAMFTAINLGVPSGLSSLIVQLQVFFTIALSFLLFRERPGAWQIAGSALAFAGMGVIAASRFSGGGFLGIALVILGALGWAGGNLVVKRIGKVDMLAFTAWASLAVPLPMLVASYILEGPEKLAALAHPSLTLIACVVYLALAATLTGYGLWNWLLARYSAAVVGPFALLTPIVGIICGAIFFGETLHRAEVSGALLIFAGLCLNVFGDRVSNLLRRALA